LIEFADWGMEAAARKAQEAIASRPAGAVVFRCRS
jgi:hypothetical protein